MKKTTISFAIVSFLATTVFAQSSAPSDKIFHNLGFSTFTDFVSTPYTSKSYFDPNYTYDVTTNSYIGKDVINYRRDNGISIFTFIYRCRYNLHEISDNFALSLSGSPAFGLTFGDYGNLAFNIPLMFGTEFGAGATYNSTSDHGGFFGAGIEYNKFPLLMMAAGKSSDQNPAIKSSWVQPVVSAGIRYWNKKNKLREINFKYGMGAKTTGGGGNLSKTSKSGTGYPTTIRLSFLVFLNY